MTTHLVIKLEINFTDWHKVKTANNIPVYFINFMVLLTQTKSSGYFAIGHL